MTQWEYQVAPIPLHNEALMLNNFGQDGWELVAIHTNAQGGLVAFLKRPGQGDLVTGGDGEGGIAGHVGHRGAGRRDECRAAGEGLERRHDRPIGSAPDRTTG